MILRRFLGLVSERESVGAFNSEREKGATSFISLSISHFTINFKHYCHSNMGDSKDYRSSRREERDRSRSPRDDRDRHHRSSRESHSHSHRDRDRSRSPRRDSKRSRRKEKERERESASESDEDYRLPEGVQEIGLDDFYIKATELKLWLWEEKGKVRSKALHSDSISLSLSLFSQDEFELMFVTCRNSTHSRMRTQGGTSLVSLSLSLRFRRFLPTDTLSFIRLL